jgi:hypothetical protein
VLVLTCIHELGHLMTVWLFGGRVQYLSMFPGIQLYPAIRWSGWSPYAIYLSYSALPGIQEPDWRYGLCTFMGSGATTATAYVALATLHVTTGTRRRARLLTTIVLLGSADLICYSVFPVLGLRGGLPFAGDKPEPYIGALEIGLPAWAYWSLLAVNALVIVGLLRRYWRRAESAEASAGQTS